MSRANELLRSTPLCVLSIITVCILTFTYQSLITDDDNFEYNYTMNPRSILLNHKYYRIFTAPFLHGDLFHIGMNMMAYLTMGTILEKTFGTMWHYTTILYSVVLTGCTELCIALITYYGPAAAGGGYLNVMDSHSLGFSGILFHLLVIQCKLYPYHDQSIFGLFKVSSKMYPYASLIAIQFLLPHVSFVGHLSGIIVGEAHTRGYLNIVLPSAQRLRKGDELTVVRKICSFGNGRIGELHYKKTPFSDDIFSTTFAPSALSLSSRGGETTLSSSSPLSTIGRFVNIGCTYIAGIVTSIKGMIFGRGTSGNENIRLSETEISTLLVGIGNSSSDHGSGSGGEWDGLETIPLSDQNESEFV